MDQFETGPASASRDLAIYIELAPNNLVLRHENKQYFRSNDFSPIFDHEYQSVINSLSNGFTGITKNNKTLKNKLVDLRVIENFDLATLGAVYRSYISNKELEIDNDFFSIKSVFLSESGIVSIELYDVRNERTFNQSLKNIK
ncbi:hypothetical protein [Pseudoalteromonas sp. T1lg122]|uniref:hypothetical protein n=1 Tax=Pseudoalteromonas sp. T1lg122 TaxID=2077094 RepID=UPI000CF66B55|nr:hypothetical protein [Pseudoalteromonas sp. T1lg122]